MGYACLFVYSLSQGQGFYFRYFLMSFNENTHTYQWKRTAIDVRENMQGLFNDLHLFLPGEFNMNEHKFLAEIVMFTSFLRSEIFITPRTISNVIIWVLFICLQCKSPLTMYFGLRIETWSSSGGLSKQIIWTAFVLVHKRSSGTNVFIIIEIMIKKWLNQNLGQSKPIV